jgi:formate dehydrogenase major subunit
MQRNGKRIRWGDGDWVAPGPRTVPGVGFPQNDAAVQFMLDGVEMTALPGETILQAAKRQGVEIPHLCYMDGMRADGNCRACVVEIEGERVLAPSCCRAPSAGMNVRATSERAVASQRMVVELLLADVPASAQRSGSELDQWAQALGVYAPRFAARAQPAQDLSHPGIAVRLDACIQCTRCVRACREVQVNDVIGYAGRGGDARVVFDIEDAMGDSSCVGCGECVQACPTGALLPKIADVVTARMASPSALLFNEKENISSLCPYCGVGCQTTIHVQDNHVVRVSGRDGPSNLGRLCVKGRFGFDYVHHPQRLLVPLVRKEGVQKDPDRLVDPENPWDTFREATWEEALDRAAGGLQRTFDSFGPPAMAGFGSAKGSNEEAYLFQKLMRTGFRTNNVDHCTRLCHASSVAALMECLSSGAVSNQVSDVQFADVFVIIGANPAVNHPVAATFMKNAIERGAKLILMDPRRTELARLAAYTLQFKPDTDVALLNALMYVIIEEGLTDDEFVRTRTKGFAALKQLVKAYNPEVVQHVCGIPTETIRAVARLYATAKNAMIFWGMGISQHVHGTDNARCLIALALMTGQIGRRGTGLHPLRGQNNVQGASDMGLIPMFYPDYRSVASADARSWFEEFWAVPLDPKAGLTVVEIMDAAKRKDVRAMYIMGENPAMSDPDVQHAREALAALDHLVVQDLFLTETASLADVVLPASAFPEKTGTFTNTDRRVQLGRKALELPGQARQDLWITQEIARRVGVDWHYGGAAEVWAEIRQAVPSCAGITWERLERESSVTYPCENEGDPGQEVVFTERFPTSDGLAKFSPAEFTHGDEPPDDEYPYVLITGRLLEHWHTGAMTRRAGVLDAIEPVPMVSLHPLDVQKLGLMAGDAVRLVTRRGELVAHTRPDETTPAGTVFIPFCFVEAAANLLTNPKLDPFGKIPEFKYCGVRLEKAGVPVDTPTYGVAANSGG